MNFNSLHLLAMYGAVLCLYVYVYTHIYECVYAPVSLDVYAHTDGIGACMCTHTLFMYIHIHITQT